jgi:hypothetical protein
MAACQVLLSYTVGAERRPVARLTLDRGHVVVDVLDDRHATAVATYIGGPHHSDRLGRAVTTADGSAFLESVLKDLVTSTYWSAVAEPPEDSVTPE